MYQPIDQLLTAREYNAETDSAWLQERIDSSDLDTTAAELVAGTFDFDWIIMNPDGILKYTQFHHMGSDLYIGYTFDAPGAQQHIGTKVFEYIKTIFPEKENVFIKPANDAHKTLIKQRFPNVVEEIEFLRYPL